MRWAVAYVDPGKEDTYAGWLRSQGIDTKVFKTSKRVKPKKKRRPVDVSVPLFPRYVFVSTDFKERWWELVRNSPGFCCMLSVNGQLCQVSQKVLEKIDDLSRIGYFDGGVGRDGLKKGDKVLVTDGVFSELEGKVLKILKEDKILIDLKSHKFISPVYFLKKMV